MVQSSNQPNSSRLQFPSQESGQSGLLELDQVTDLDQAITMSRAGKGTNAKPSAIPPRPTVFTPKPAPKPAPAAPVTPSASAQPTQSARSAAQPTYAAPSTSSAPTQPSTPSEPPVAPVRSAKEAINAMYSANNPARLSDYLGTSAKEIINASAKPASAVNSAASLHHAASQRRSATPRPQPAMPQFSRPASTPSVAPAQSARPTAQPAYAAPSTSSAPTQPVRPALRRKDSPIVVNSRPRAVKTSLASRPQPLSTRSQKGRIKVTTPSPAAETIAALKRAAQAATSNTASAARSAEAPAAPRQASAAPRPSSTAASSSPRGGRVLDFARPAARRAASAANTATQNASGAKTQSTSTPNPQPATAPQPETPRVKPRSVNITSLTEPATKFKPSIKFSSKSPKNSKSAKAKAAQPNSSAQPASQTSETAKRRFRLAPKGFAAKKPEQARPGRRKFMSFSNPDYTVAVPKASPAVEIYGLTPDPEPASERGKDGLGVVEDYRPKNPANPPVNTSASDRPAESAAPAEPTQKSPDNNRYALGGQSPFFLKSVSVEKRPLSDAPTRRADTISPLYTEPGTVAPRKNVYDGKSAAKTPKTTTKKSSPRDLPQRPTVIIPSSRRSHTPLFLLLILTVLLGAAVGAAVYFFFFQ